MSRHEDGTHEVCREGWLSYRASGRASERASERGKKGRDSPGGGWGMEEELWRNCYDFRTHRDGSRSVARYLLLLPLLMLLLLLLLLLLCLCPCPCPSPSWMPTMLMLIALMPSSCPHALMLLHRPLHVFILTILLIFTQSFVMQPHVCPITSQPRLHPYAYTT
jgi:hypothetical protein